MADAFQTAALIAEMAEIVPLQALSIDGGLSVKSYLAGFLATVLQRPITLAGTPECTAFGTASLAARALGQSLAAPPSDQTYTPGPSEPAWTHRFENALTRSKGWHDL